MEPFAQGSTNQPKGAGSGKLFHCDASALLSELDSQSVDLIVTSPPYCIGKEYDKYLDPESFSKEISCIWEDLIRVLKPGGSMCWQVGYHVRSNEIVPLDFLIHTIASKSDEMKLRNRIAWTFGHGAHSTRRFSGRHETVLWYTKGDDYRFDLDAVRVEQKYPGKKSYKGPNRGEFSGNPLGKNPGDVWDIPNVKSRHVEKTEHPCQFPLALVRRLINALSPSKGTVLDPFVGSGTTVVGAMLEGRVGLGSDLSEKYLGIAKARMADLKAGRLKLRDDVPVLDPKKAGSVAVRPAHFVKNEESYGA